MSQNVEDRILYYRKFSLKAKKNNYDNESQLMTA